MVLLNMETAIEAYVMYAATRLLKMPNDEAAKMCEEALKAVRNKKTHMYSFLWVVRLVCQIARADANGISYIAVGRKPE